MPQLKQPDSLISNDQPEKRSGIERRQFAFININAVRGVANERLGVERRCPPYVK